MMQAHACVNDDLGELLREAAATGDAQQVQNLLAQGADISSADAEGWTALHWTCSHTHVAEVLLQNGASVDAADRQGKTTLHWAATDGHTEVAALLLSYGAQVNKVDQDNWTPLQWAHGNPAVAELLLLHGADVHTRDRFGKTVLHWSSQDGYVVMVRLLIAHGANVNIADSDGMTPLHWAAHGGHLETVQVLLQAGANASIGSEDSQGTTPLAWAAYAGHRHIIQLMLDQQGWAAGVGITESNLVSAARAAAMQGQMSVFAVLTAEIGLRHPAALPSLLVGPLAPEPASAFIAMTSLCAEQRQRELQHQEESQRQQEQLVHEREELAAVKAGTQHLIIQAAGVAKKAMQLAGSDVQ